MVAADRGGEKRLKVEWHVDRTPLLTGQVWRAPLPDPVSVPPSTPWPPTTADRSGGLPKRSDGWLDLELAARGWRTGHPKLREGIC